MPKVRESRGYMGVTIDPVNSGSSGVRWCALVDFKSFAGYLKSDTLDGIKGLIRYYKGKR